MLEDELKFQVRSGDSKSKFEHEILNKFKLERTISKQRKGSLDFELSQIVKYSVTSRLNLQNFEHLRFEFRICFVIRYSDFGFN